jgi:Rha family phage regulatory protein
MNNLVEVKKERIYCKSNMVAEIFERRHDHVLESIRELLKTCSKEFSLPNFWESTYKVKGREYPCYEMTKDGFTMIAMGFTGEKAVQFKELYINKFNEMERLLTSQGLLKMEFKDLTDNICLLHEEVKNYHFSNELNMINKIVLKMTAREFKKANNIEDKNSIRPYLNEKQINDILLLQRIDSGLLLAIPDYFERKAMLENMYHKKLKLLENKE